jgi:hypothetical protein
VAVPLATTATVAAETASYVAPEIIFKFNPAGTRKECSEPPDFIRSVASEVPTLLTNSGVMLGATTSTNWQPFFWRRICSHAPKIGGKLR